MAELKLWNQETAWRIVLSDPPQMPAGCTLQVVSVSSRGVRLAGMRCSRLVAWETICTFGGWFVLAKKAPWPSSQIPLNAFLQIGREQFENPALSLCHFAIQPSEEGWQILDLQSTNGTFLNGNRLQAPALLCQGDWIFACGISFQYFDGWLFADAPCKNPQVPVLKKEERCLEQSPLILPEEAQPENWKAESFVPVEPPTRTGWFSALGPSLMILISSSASVLSLLLRDPENRQSAAILMISSLSMSAAFLAYALINVRLQSRQQKKKTAGQEELYLEYLDHLKAQIEERAVQLEKPVHAYLERLEEGGRGQFLAGLPEDWQIPVACERQSILKLELPPIRYDQRQSRQSQALHQTADAVPNVLQLVRWKRKQVLEVTRLEMEDGLLLFGLWSTLPERKNRRWIWVGLQQPSVLFHPLCRLNGSPLWFADSQALAEAADWLIGSGMEFCVFSLVAQDPKLLTEASWILPAASMPQDFSRSDLQEQPRVHVDSILPFLKNRKGWMEESLLRQQAACMQPVQQGFLPVEEILRPGCQAAHCRCDHEVLQVHLDESLVWDLEADGPHALVAGTTGSGKSEGLTTILLELSLRNSPEHLQYILIDFKGGAFGSVFYRFPHMAGSVTNLQASSFSRLQQALDKELRRRQELFARWQKDDPFHQASIQAWNEAHPQQPLSHLLILCDEFAELKARLPEAMKDLQKTARIGRSLGIHLILATQKPAGVVDEQIWSNTRSKLCFMVHSTSDSREVLGHDAASTLKRPGECILQVSGKGWKQGRVYYSRQPIQGRISSMELNPEGSSLYEPPRPGTFLELASALILEAEDPRRWILYPDFEQEPVSFPGMFMDELSCRTPWKPQAGSPVLLLAPAKHLEQAAGILAAGQPDSVFFFPSGCSAPSALPEGLECLDWKSLWAFESGPFAARQLLVWLEVDIPAAIVRILVGLMKRKAVPIVLLAQSASRLERDLLAQVEVRLACAIHDREELYALFSAMNHSCEAWPVFTGQNKEKSIRIGFCPSISTEDPAKRRLVKERTPRSGQHSLLPAVWVHNPVIPNNLAGARGRLLGFEAQSGRPWYWQNTELIFCTMGPGTSKAQALISAWQQSDPLCACQKYLQLLELPRQQQELIERKNKGGLCQPLLVYAGPADGEVSWIIGRIPEGKPADALYVKTEEGFCRLDWPEPIL